MAPLCRQNFYDGLEEIDDSLHLYVPWRQLMPYREYILVVRHSNPTRIEFS